MIQPGRLVSAAFFLGLFTVAAQWGTALAAGQGSSGEKPYKVNEACRKGDAQNCKVDMKTYIGWRTFNAFCSRCHGEAAEGSSIAPNLMDRIQQKHMTFSDFVQVVASGKKGSMGVMPAWGQNPNVNNKFEQLWAYLQARTDGVLPPGRPGKLRNE
ncbi:MAG TPA: cytochrome c [Gammaproteobacteria bacterium]|nr:cytochrome c [Gammaproteobacteria bacterium]